MSQVIENLPNEEYHRGEQYSEYISSTQLRWYEVSPKYYKWMLTQEPTQSEALQFGSLFHEMMQAYVNNQPMPEFAVFSAPTNEKTGKEYGSTTKAYKDAYEQFVSENEGKTIVTQDTLTTLDAMYHTIVGNDDPTAEFVANAMRHGKGEVSILTEIDGVKVKVRPDVLTRRRILDWKTTDTNDLTEESINRIISRYGYDISAAMYQAAVHEATGQWHDFYLVFVSKNAPYDFAVVNMCKWAYEYDEESDIITPNIGAIKFRQLLAQHKWCLEHNQWEGSTSRVVPDFQGKRIITPEPPAYENYKMINFYNNILEYE